MKLPFFSRTFVEKLRTGADSNQSNYGPKTHWIADFAGGLSYLHDSAQIVDPPPALKITAEASADPENSRKIFQWLRNITPAIAMEERLWACLSHTVFPEYMHARWPVKDGDAIQRRYLFEGKSFASLSRNGIARLWWAGYLTFDESRANPFELTDTLFLRQDIQVSLLERSIGKCRNVRTCVLDFLRANSDWLSDEKFGRRIQLLLKELNLLGGVSLLDSLPPAAIHDHMRKVAKSLIASATTQSNRI
jgi:hypothetical protein